MNIDTWKADEVADILDGNTSKYFGTPTICGWVDCYCPNKPIIIVVVPTGMLWRAHGTQYKYFFCNAHFEQFKADKNTYTEYYRI